MANLLGTDRDDQPIEVAASGDGSTGDPFILKREVVVSALPAGAATAAHQVTQSGYLDGLEAALASLLTAVQDLATGAETQPVSLASAPLPTGAATAAHQVTQNGYLDGLETALAGLQTAIEALATGAETQPVSVASLPLPTGAATQTTLAALLAELQAKADLVETQPVSLASTPLPTGAATAAHQVTAHGYLDGLEGSLASILSELQAHATLAETQPVSAASLPLPTGAATAAHQVTQNGYLDGLEVLLNSILTDLQAKADLSETLALSIAKIHSAASTNGTLVLTGARKIHGWYLANKAVGQSYVRIYNKATAPTVGTDSPAFVIELPGNASGAVTSKDLKGHIPLSLGFGYAITAGAADLNSDAVAADDVIGFILYE